MRTPKDIESLAERIAFEPDALTDERVLSAAEAALDNRTNATHVHPTCLMWRQIVKNPIAKLTLAAALVVVALFGLYFFAGTSHVGWASVLEKVRDIDSYVYRIREVETTGPRPESFEFVTEKETTVYQSLSYGRLREQYWNGELFARYCWSRSKNEYLGICYPLEEYERLSLQEGWAGDSADPRQMIMRVLEGPYVALGRTTVAGRTVEGVQTQDPNLFLSYVPKDVERFTAAVWTDVQTELPVWVEIRFASQGSELQTTIVVDQFQWDVTLAPSLFEPNVPAHFAFDRTDKPRPDSVPHTDPAEMFAENTQAEPYLGDFDRVRRPDVNDLTLLGVDTSLPRPELRLTSHDQLWQTQDQFMAMWPAYDQVQARLRQELQNTLDIDPLSVDELVALGIALRQRFWALGGCLSQVSYPYAYAARMLTEIAHERVPEDMAVTDQFVESIITYELGWIHHPDPNERVKNPIYPGLLTDLRAGQFGQIRRAVTEGHVPTWKDFVRIQDLILLLNTRRDDYVGALEATQWLIAQAETGGWTYYLEQLRRMETSFAGGERRVVGLFLDAPDAFPEEYRFGRRLFSFQGPAERSRQLLPIHLRHLKGW